MVLAGLLLKLGGYGLIRVSAVRIILSERLKSLIGPLALVGGLITRLICLRQVDIKALIAYSSIGHISFVILIVLGCLRGGVSGGILIIIAHGVTSSGIFALAGVIYELFGRRALVLVKGILAMFPAYATMWFMAAARNIAAPPTINLGGEIMAFNPRLAIGSGFMWVLIGLIFFSGGYSLYIYRRVCHGRPTVYSSAVQVLRARGKVLIISHVIPSFLLITKID